MSPFEQVIPPYAMQYHFFLARWRAPLPYSKKSLLTEPPPPWWITSLMISPKDQYVNPMLPSYSQTPVTINIGVRAGRMREFVKYLNNGWNTRGTEYLI